MNHGRDDNAVSTVHRNGGVKEENKEGVGKKKEGKFFFVFFFKLEVHL